MRTPIEQVKRAYADCQPGAGEESYDERVLMWKGVWIPPDKRDLLADCLNAIGEYNRFDPELVMEILEDYPEVSVTVAREHSVALYLRGFDDTDELKEVAAQLRPDEVSSVWSSPIVDGSEPIHKYGQLYAIEHLTNNPRLRCWWD